MKTYSVSLKQWVEILSMISAEQNIFAPIEKGNFLDYERITENNVEQISYNKAKPTTFFILGLASNIGFIISSTS